MIAAIPTQLANPLHLFSLSLSLLSISSLWLQLGVGVWKHQKYEFSAKEINPSLPKEML